MQKIKKWNLKIDSKLVEFIEKEVIPGTDIDPNKFWSKFDDIVHNLSIINNPNTKKSADDFAINRIAQAIKKITNAPLNCKAFS